MSRRPACQTLSKALDISSATAQLAPDMLKALAILSDTFWYQIYFALLDAKDNTSGLLRRGEISDLPLFRTLLAICQKSREPSLWEVMDSFVLLEYASLAAFFTGSKSTEFKDTLTWNISQVMTNTIPVCRKIVISYAMKWGILIWVWQKVNGNWDKNMIRISQLRKRCCRTNANIRINK